MVAKQQGYEGRIYLSPEKTFAFSKYYIIINQSKLISVPFLTNNLNSLLICAACFS